jgi:hypothetical protein
MAHNSRCEECISLSTPTFAGLLKSPIPTNILGCAINVKSLHPLSNISMSEGVMVDIVRVIGTHIIAVKHNFNVGNPPDNFS